MLEAFNADLAELHKNGSLVKVLESYGIDPSTADILASDLRIASSVVSWRHTSVKQLDVWTAEKLLRKNGMVARAGEVADALGPGAKGWAKLRALHVRRYVEMDLTHTSKIGNVRGSFRSLTFTPE